jgi:hypothetical protein
MMTRILARSLYTLVGVSFLLAGTTVLLLGTGLLPHGFKEVIEAEADGVRHTMHIMQEFATATVLLGLVTLWFVRHYEISRSFHWAMTLFWALFALIHWFDIRGPIGSVKGPSINTIPFVVFLLVGLLRERTERVESSA